MDYYLRTKGMAYTKKRLRWYKKIFYIITLQFKKLNQWEELRYVTSTKKDDEENK